MVEAVQAVGNLVGGVAGYESGKFNKKADYAAARDEEQDGSDTEARIRENARQIIGEQVAAQGSNGFQGGTGSALDALVQSQTNAMIDVLSARRKAASAARSLRVRGDVAKAAGQNALVQGMFGAAAAGARGASDWASATSGSSGGGGSFGGGGSSGGSSGGGYDASYDYSQGG